MVSLTVIPYIPFILSLILTLPNTHARAHTHFPPPRVYEAVASDKQHAASLRKYCMHMLADYITLVAVALPPSTQVRILVCGVPCVAGASTTERWRNNQLIAPTNQPTNAFKPD